MMDVDISRNRLCKHVECSTEKDHVSMNAMQINNAFDKSKIKHSSNNPNTLIMTLKLKSVYKTSRA